MYKVHFIPRYNIMLSTYDWILHHFVHIPAQTTLLKKHFGHLDGPLPSITELRKNISVIFVNAHRSITYPRPSLPVKCSSVYNALNLAFLRFILKTKYDQLYDQLQVLFILAEHTSNHQNPCLEIFSNL